MERMTGSNSLLWAVCSLVVVVGLLSGCKKDPPATPEGMVGEPFERFDALPETAEKIPLTKENGTGVIMDLDGRANGTEIRLWCWNAPVDEGRPSWMFAGVGVEVVENPNGTNVSWEVQEHVDYGARMSIDISWREGGSLLGGEKGSLMGLMLSGRLDPKKCLLRPN